MASFSDASILRGASTVLLYGAGFVGSDLYRILSATGIDVPFFLDRRGGAGHSHAGIPVFTPDQCPVSPSAREGLPVVLSIFNRDVNILPIADALAASGFTRVVPFVEVHSMFSSELGDRFWLTARRYFEGAADDIETAAHLWADDTSRELYKSNVTLRRTGVYEASMFTPSRDSQYFPTDISGWIPSDRPVRFVDCGAYTGDTLEWMAKSGRRLESAAAFEPDPCNFRDLAARVLGLYSAKVALWPCAVTGRTQAVRFDVGQQETSRIAAGGNSVVQGVALDDALIGWMPSLIKMDIEGAELDALDGARRVISESRPFLAICVYHRPNHLWDIPLAMSAWPETTGYRLYLRSHGFDGFDTVLYAVPSSAFNSVPQTSLT